MGKPLWVGWSSQSCSLQEQWHPYSGTTKAKNVFYYSFVLIFNSTCSSLFLWAFKFPRKVRKALITQRLLSIFCRVGSGSWQPILLSSENGACRSAHLGLHLPLRVGAELPLLSEPATPLFLLPCFPKTFWRLPGHSAFQKSLYKSDGCSQKEMIVWYSMFSPSRPRHLILIKLIASRLVAHTERECNAGDNPAANWDGFSPNSGVTNLKARTGVWRQNRVRFLCTWSIRGFQRCQIELLFRALA